MSACLGCRKYIEIFLLILTLAQLFDQHGLLGGANGRVRCDYVLRRILPVCVLHCIELPSHDNHSRVAFTSYLHPSLEGLLAIRNVCMVTIVFFVMHNCKYFDNSNLWIFLMHIIF